MLLPMERSQWLSVALIAQTVTRVIRGGVLELLSPLAWFNPPQIMHFPEEPGCFSEDAGVEAGAVTFDPKEGGHQRAEEEAHSK